MTGPNQESKSRSKYEQSSSPLSPALPTRSTQQTIKRADVSAAARGNVLQSLPTRERTASSGTTLSVSSSVHTPTSMPELRTLHTGRYPHRVPGRPHMNQLLYEQARKQIKTISELNQLLEQSQRESAEAKSQTAAARAEIRQIKERIQLAKEEANDDLARDGLLRELEWKDLEIFNKNQEIEKLLQEREDARGKTNKHQLRDRFLSIENDMLKVLANIDTETSPRDGKPNAGEVFLMWRVKTCIFRCIAALTSNLSLKAINHAAEAVRRANAVGKESLIRESQYWQGLALYRAGRYDEAKQPLRAVENTVGDHTLLAEKLLGLVEKHGSTLEREDSSQKAAKRAGDTTLPADFAEQSGASLMNFERRRIDRLKRPPELKLTSSTHDFKDSLEMSFKAPVATPQARSSPRGPLTAPSKLYGFSFYRDQGKKSTMDFPTPKASMFIHLHNGRRPTTSVTTVGCEKTYENYSRSTSASEPSLTDDDGDDCNSSHVESNAPLSSDEEMLLSNANTLNDIASTPLAEKLHRRASSGQSNISRSLSG